jgi:hypothetical protein
MENLNQLINSLEEVAILLEEAYKKEDFEKFNKSKKAILQIQKHISEVLK